MAWILAICLTMAAGPDPQTVVGPPAGPKLEEVQTEARTREVASLLRCPVCQGLSVEASPSDSARAMRDEVKEMVRAGYDRDQILAWFQASYGDFILLEPRKEGFALWVWALPGLFLLGGGAVLASSFRRPTVAKVPELDPALNAYRQKVRQDTSESESR